MIDKYISEGNLNVDQEAVTEEKNSIKIQIIKRPDEPGTDVGHK